MAGRRLTCGVVVERAGLWLGVRAAGCGLRVRAVGCACGLWAARAGCGLRVRTEITHDLAAKLHFGGRPAWGRDAVSPAKCETGVQHHPPWCSITRSSRYSQRYSSRDTARGYRRSDTGGNSGAAIPAQGYPLECINARRDIRCPALRLQHDPFAAS